jgi:chemotaxis protein CheD
MAPVTSEPVRAHYLCPGQLVVAAQPTIVTTIVSSCVAVGVWDASAGVGGVCHFQLPRWLGTGARTPSYADVAIEELLEKLETLGARPETREAKLFGGACLTPQVRRQHAPLGDENVEEALLILAGAGLTVSAVESGGSRARKIQFHTADGATRVTLL